LAIKCAKCGYARNDDNDRLCSLCGEVLAGAAPPAPPPPPPAPRPGDTVIADDDGPGEDATGIGKAPPAAPVEATGMFAMGGLCHLKCSLLERPLRLRPDRVVTVGRSRESDISIPSQMVSRNHGQIAHEKGLWVYTDLKSSNGSRVNGKRVDRHVLQTGDVIDVGGFMITYKEIHDLSDVSEQPEDEGKTMTIDPSMLKRVSLSGMDGVALLGGLGGSLEDIDIADILQLMEIQRKNGTLTLDFEGAVGRVHIKDGMMVHAEYGKFTGEKAVFRMLSKAKGSFHFDPREHNVSRTINRPTTSVLMDAAREIDEGGR